MGTLYIVQNFKNGAQASKKNIGLIFFICRIGISHAYKAQEEAKEWRKKWWKPAEKCLFFTLLVLWPEMWRHKSGRNTFQAPNHAKPLQVDIMSWKMCLFPGCLPFFWLLLCISVIYTHMGQFLQGGKNGRLMSFFLKVKPPCDQTWWDSLVFSILSCFSYVLDAENTLVGPVGPF